MAGPLWAFTGSRAVVSMEARWARDVAAVGDKERQAEGWVRRGGGGRGVEEGRFLGTGPQPCQQTSLDDAWAGFSCLRATCSVPLAALERTPQPLSPSPMETTPRLSFAPSPPSGRVHFSGASALTHPALIRTKQDANGIRQPRGLAASQVQPCPQLSGPWISPL